MDTDEEAGAQQDIKAKNIKNAAASRKLARQDIKNAPPVPPTHPPRPTMAAGIMCTRLRLGHDGPEPEILVTKRRHANRWEFPKGRRNIGEDQDLKMTAIREFQEETGVNLNFLDKDDFIELGSETYSTRYEDKKIVKWYWLHLHVHVDHQFKDKEYSTEQVAWFTETQLQRDIYIKGGKGMLELAKKALDFVRRDNT